jgi:tripartite-type tricarboxylate transporter receptor subunit TctC
MLNILKSLAFGTLALLGTAAVATTAQAQGFYEGKTVTLIVPHSASGGFAQYAQLLAPRLKDQLKAADVRIEHHTGAGGILGINLVWHAAPDGMTIGLSSGSSIMLAYLAQGEGVQFDATKFTYLGRVASEDRIIFVGKDSTVKTVDDAKALGRPFKVPSQGVDDDFYAMAMLGDAIGFDVQFVTGYEGGGDTTLAVIRGDGDGRLTSWTSAQSPLEAGDVRPLITIGKERHPDHPDVPTALEAVTDPAKQNTIRSLMNIQTLHRTFFGPPGMDPDAVEAMRAAVTAVLENPGTQEAAKAAELSLSHMPGAEQQKVVEELHAASADVPAILKAAEASIK